MFTRRLLTTQILVAAFLLPLALLSHDADASVRSMVINEVSIGDNSQLDRQRRIVSKLCTQNFGHVRLQGSKDDLYYLQKIIDKQLVSRTDTYDLQALGVILGDIMVKNLSLRWVVVQDQYGRSRALQYGNSKNLFFPVTMISKRVQAGLPVNVRELYKKTEESVKSLTFRTSQYQSAG